MFLMQGVRPRFSRFQLISILVILLLCGVVVIVGAQRGSAPATVDCTPYGIAAEDPRARVPELKLRAGELPMVEEGWPEGETSDGVRLGQTFVHEERAGSYHLFTRGVDFNRPVGMLVRLHGDGAYEYHRPQELVNCLAQVAASHNMILLAPHTPDTATRTWWSEITPNLHWVDALAGEVLAEHGVAGGNVWWMGYSGGAEMLSYGIIPRMPAWVTGGAIMVGGGGAPRELEMKVPLERRQGMNLHWVSGLDDDGSDPREPFDAVGAAREGAEWYRSHGFTRVATSFPPGQDHFSLPQAKVLVDILDSGEYRMGVM